MATFATKLFSNENPLLSDWSNQPYGLPPFARISPEHFSPAFRVGMDSHLQELKNIVEKREAATFSNTIASFDRAGGVLNRVGMVFSNLCSSNSPPELQAVQLEMAPILAAHESKVFMLPGLFARIAAVYDARSTSGLDSEQIRLVERIQLDFVRAGAKFSEADQKRYSAIMERLSTLLTTFQQNVMADESEITMDLTEQDMVGCPEFLISAAKAAAAERKKPDGTYVITLSRSLVEPFITFSPRRDLRQRAWKLWTNRGQLEPEKRDNLAIAKEILKLRCEQSALHGYATFGDYQTADTMAQSPAKVMELLERVWGPAVASAERERGFLEDFLSAELGVAGSQVESWDWRYCAEKVRLEKYNFDESQLKPYLSLPAMQKALFTVCERLYGLRFVRVPEAPTYHPDVEVYEVREQVEGEDRLVAVFLHDNYARANKQSGAWMSAFQEQTRNSNVYSYEHKSEPDAHVVTATAPAPAPDSASTDADCATAYVHISSTPSDARVVPVIINNNNFAKGDATTPCLLSFDDAITLFHELGHGLHGMLSDVRYSRLAGTSVLRDFVELPSQLLEHWLRSTDVVLKEHAIHHATGETISSDMLAKLTAARNFNQGFATVEYTICALLDQALHALPAAQVASLDIQAFEEKELARLGMPKGISMRHRPAHFQHLFSSSAYASAYYVYLWAEVLDADAFDSFLAKGDVYDKETADRLRKWIYSSGNSLEPSAAYRGFKGSDPSIEPMLKKKGLLAKA